MTSGQHGGGGYPAQIDCTMRTGHSLQNVDLDVGILFSADSGGKHREPVDSSPGLNMLLLPADQCVSWQPKAMPRTGRKGKRKPSTIYL